MKVAADIIIYGTPNKTDISSSITKKLEQSPEALLEGSLMAVEAATEMIVHSLDMNRDIYPKVDRDSINLKEFLTEQCHNSVFDSYTSLLSDGKKINLISTPKEDIFFAWIERLQGMYFGIFLFNFFRPPKVLYYSHFISIAYLIISLNK